MVDSIISLDENGVPTTYAGPDAVNLFRAKLLLSSLKLYANCGIIPTRGVGVTQMMRLVGGYTGKSYRRGKAAQLLACEDLKQWILAMQSAIPVERRE